MADRYDLAVIGSGPAGQKAAIAAAKLGKRVAVVDEGAMLGGVCLHTGTIPSKTLREAVIYLTGIRQRSFYGADYSVKARIRREDLKFRVEEVVKRQQEVVHDQLLRNNVAVLDGMARFTGPHTLEVHTDQSCDVIEADHIMIACGTRPARREGIPFDHPCVLDADTLLQMHTGELRRSGIVIGAGIIGLEYASMMVALGIETTVIDARETVLDFVDREIIGHLAQHLQHRGMSFRLGKKFESIVGTADGVTVTLEGGEEISAEVLLYAAGRQPNTDRLGLEAIDLPVDTRGRLEVNEHYQTAIPHIYAAGDVIGFPALASTSMEQGRLAACHMFGEPCEQRPHLLPYGIYTIPEISMVGAAEHQAAAKGRACQTGIAHFRELAKAQIIGDRTGLLKLVFDPETLEVLGVHVIGEDATDLVHIGQMVMAAGGTIETLRDTVFNYPTLAEAYKVAAIDGLNKIAHRKPISRPLSSTRRPSSRANRPT